MEKIKKFLQFAWPFIVLLIFLVWAWFYIKPLLPEDFFSAQRMLDKVGGIFGPDEGPAHPDEKYDFHYVQDSLKPKTEAEVRALIRQAAAPAPPQEAVRAANAAELTRLIKDYQAAAVISLAAGEYRVNLVLDKDIRLYGRATGTVLMALDPDQAVISVKNSAASLNNLTIKNSRIGLSAEKAEISLDNLEFMGISATACYAKDSELAFTNSRITGSGSAVKTLDSRGGISRSIIQNNRKSGIDLRASNFKITDNIITANQSYGVYADQYSTVEVAGNYIEGNKGFAVRIEKEREIYR